MAKESWFKRLVGFRCPGCKKLYWFRPSHFQDVCRKCGRERAEASMEWWDEKDKIEWEWRQFQQQEEKEVETRRQEVFAEMVATKVIEKMIEEASDGNTD